MQRFKPSDGVFIIPKFAHLYTDRSAVVIDVKVNPFRPMFNEYTVEFADRSTARLLEFQIIEDLPECETVVAALIFDSRSEMPTIRTHDRPSGGQIIFQTPAFRVDIRTHTSKSGGSIMGQIIERRTKDYLKDVQVLLLRDAIPIGRTIPDSLGVFEFIDVPRGPLNILVMLPEHSLRIFGTFSI